MDVLRLSVVPYVEAWDLQRDLAARRAAGDAPDTLILLEHPDVYTAGRRTEAWERPVDGTPVVDVDRGGKITWHGPGQLVGYPIVALPRPLDVVAYVRALEDAMIAVCGEFGVPTHRVEGRSGVWTLDDERKLGAIGIRVRKGVTYHGVALNCCPDLGAFGRIVPCGITDASAGSLTGELGRTVTVAEVRPVVERHLLHHLGHFLAGGSPSEGDGAIRPAGAVRTAPEPAAVPA
ncbi:lipoate-protein ligase B [Pseudofrankia asymbiotica]|uniref:Octanoyltransferase n=1 Tax=Pseudofrankia asymbiotica TaxID=1834516 RepID=A0A1V2I811_9ACTN|nr:lipoyl(octanoyl) transferase LipB [Pseudofrankia asymbiotica]ONH28361.1 lipoate-protein ligase B [Pseudofrankia asymbiotica]